MLGVGLIILFRKQRLLTNALTTLTTSLTIPQYQQFTAWITALTLQLGPTGIIQAASILKNALWNNLCPFFGQLSAWLNVNQGRLTEAGNVANVYRLVNEFLTFNRTKTIVLRVQTELANAGMWTQVRNSAIGNWILFSQYGC
uniref:Uncharacterized protein n=1 Tax=Acrobeloides nanus TaxID=290746 RepID=A0A914EM31_9BILA